MQASESGDDPRAVLRPVRVLDKMLRNGIFPAVIDAESVKRLIIKAIPDAQVELEDLTGTQDHYEARVVSPVFAGKSLIDQHRLVYAALGDAMNGPIHALALRTQVPAGSVPPGSAAPGGRSELGAGGN